MLLFGAMTTLSGLAILFALLRGARPNTAVLAGSLACALFFLSLFAVLLNGKMGWKDIQTTLRTSSEQSVQAQIAAWKAQGVSQDKLDEFKDEADRYLPSVLRVYPSLFALASAWLGLFSYYLIPFFFRRFITRVPRPMPFRQWIIPEPLIFCFIAGALLNVGSKWVEMPGFEWLGILGNNLIVFFGGVYIMGGFSIISYYLQKWNVPIPFRFPIYIFLAVYFFVPLFCLGLLDVWMDLRKIKTPPLERTV